MYTKQERINMINEARQLMVEAMSLLTDAVEDTAADTPFNAYTVPTIEVLIQSEHQWLASNSGNLDALISLIEDGDEDEAEHVDDGSYPGQYIPTGDATQPMAGDRPAQPLDHLPGAYKIHPVVKASYIGTIKMLFREYGFSLSESSAYAKGCASTN